MPSPVVALALSNGALMAYSLHPSTAADLAVPVPAAVSFPHAGRSSAAVPAAAAAAAPATPAAADAKAGGSPGADAGSAVDAASDDGDADGATAAAAAPPPPPPPVPLPPATRPLLAGVFRFCRIPLDMPPTQVDGDAVPPADKRPHGSWLVPFMNAHGWTGVAFLGPSPLMLVPSKGAVKCVPLHPALVEAQAVGVLPAHLRPHSVPALCEFHTKAHPHGLALAFRDGVQLCDLAPPSDVVVEGSVAVHRVPIGCTPHAIEFLPTVSKPGVPLYAVIVSTDVPRDPAAEAKLADEQLDQDGEEYNQQAARIGPDEDFVEPDERGEPPVVNKVFEVQLYLGGSWTHLDSYRLDVSEQGLSVCEVCFTNERGRLRPLIAVGTGYVTPRGEDKAGYGNIVLLELFTEEDGSQSLKQVAKTPVKGAVSAVAYMHAQERYLVASCGMRHPRQIAVYGWLKGRGGHELRMCAFFDSETYVTSLRVVKHYVMYTDVYRSVRFLRFNKEPGDPGGDLELLGSDRCAVTTTASEFMSNGSALGLVVTDMERNVQVFTYTPSAGASVGVPLTRAGDFHVGCAVTDMLKARQHLLPDDRTPKFCVAMTMLDGGYSLLSPVDETTFKRLLMLQKVMTYSLPHAGGLNPKAYRLFNAKAAWHPIRAKKIIDGPLVWTYVSLDRRLQRQLARAIGTTPARILHSLRQLDLATWVF